MLNVKEPKLFLISISYSIKKENSKMSANNRWNHELGLHLVSACHYIVDSPVH